MRCLALAGALACSATTLANVSAEWGCLSVDLTQSDWLALSEATVLVHRETTIPLEPATAACPNETTLVLSLSLEVGQSLQVLLSETGRFHLSDFPLMALQSEADWIRLSDRDHDNVNSSMTLAIITASTHLPTETTQLASIQIEAVSGDETHRLQLPIQLRIREESPLFRNRFQVDPLPGQFSGLPVQPKSNRIAASG